MINYPIYIAVFIAATLSVLTRKLTIAAGITGFIVAVLIYQGAGYTGILMLAAFFLMGTASTGWQSSKKLKIGIAEKDKGRRTAGQVIANGGVAALLGAIVWVFPAQWAILRLMIAGSLASATADTLSSELGSVYGKRFYDIITFKKVKPGPDGVVSLEGTAIGIVGAFVIALIYVLSFGADAYVVELITLAGAIGNVADSVLGATLERNKWIGNNTVNFLNTATGAGVCWLLHQMI